MLQSRMSYKPQWTLLENKGEQKWSVVQKHSSGGCPVLMLWWGEPGRVYHWALQQVSSAGSSAGSSGGADGAVAEGSGDAETAGTQTRQLTERQSPAPADSPWGPLWTATCPCRWGIWRSGDRRLNGSEHEQRQVFACPHTSPHTKPQGQHEKEITFTRTYIEYEEANALQRLLVYWFCV